MTPLHQLNDDVRQAPAHLFKPRDTIRDWRLWGVYQEKSEGLKNYRMALGMLTSFYEQKGPSGEKVRTFLDAGENPPLGVIIIYYLQETPTDPITLTILDDNGEIIKTFSSQASENETAAQLLIPAAPGLNRFVWDMRYPDAHNVPGDFNGDTKLTGPLAVPGNYQVQLQVGDQTYTQSFAIHPDPRVTVTQADLQAQFDLWLKIRDKISETHEAVIRLRHIKEQVANWGKLLGETHSAIAEAAETLQEKLKAIEVELIQTEANTAGDRLRLRSRLNSKLNTLISVVGVADFAPTQQSYEVFEHLSGQVDEQLGQLQRVIETDVTAFNNLVREASDSAIVI